MYIVEVNFIVWRTLEYVEKTTTSYKQIIFILFDITVELVQSDILWHLTKIYGPKVFLLAKIKPEYCDILYNPVFLVPWCVWLDRIHCNTLFVLK
jgi:hypothetical protein